MGGLRAQVERDLSTTLEGDWGVPVTVTNPDGRTRELDGASGDIGALIDPSTGIPVAGRTAHITLRLSSLKAAGFAIPQAVTRGLPWRFGFEDRAGDDHEFSVRHSMPDRSLGLVTCVVEHWTR